MTLTSATGPDRRQGRRAGFTLTELMVVLAILGLTGAAVIVTAAPSGAAGAQAEADAFAVALVRARDEAVLANETVEVAASRDGYDYQRVTLQGREPLADRAFQAETWADGVTAELPDAEAAALRFRFDPTGAAEPGVLTLRDQSRVVRVGVDETGKVAVDATAR